MLLTYRCGESIADDSWSVLDDIAQPQDPPLTGEASDTVRA